MLDEKKLREYLRYKPNKWQREVRKSNARFKIIDAGRGSGKTYYVTNDTVDGVVVDFFVPNAKVWIIAPDYSLTQKVWTPLVALARGKLSSCVNKITDTKGSFEIRTALGGFIQAKSAEEPEKLVGERLTKIVIDEAPSVKEKAWTQSLRPTLVGIKGVLAIGKAIFIGTPKGKNWYYDLYMKGQDPEEPEWASWQYTSYDNEWLDKKELAKLVKDMPEFEYRQEILAEFKETLEQVFRNIKKNIKGAYQKHDKKCSYLMGVDLGRKHSKTTIFVINEMTNHVDYFDRFGRVDWEMATNRIKGVYNMYGQPDGCFDATSTGGDVIHELLLKKGIGLEPFIFHERSKREAINKLAYFIENGKISYPNIDILIKELDSYGREISPKSGRILYRPIGKWADDCVDGLAMAVWNLQDIPITLKIEKPITIPNQQF